MKKITSLILVACISLTFAACSQGETAELTLPDYATVTAGALEGYEEWIQSTRGHFYTAQTYNSPERDSFAGYFCAIPPTSGEVIEMYGPEDEGLILKGTYAYNFVDGDLSSFKLSFEETDCELHDLTLTVNGVEEAFPITLSEDNTGEVKLDVPMEKPELSGTFIQLESTLTYDGVDYEYHQQI